MSDNVNHPAHYVREGRKECIQEMIEKHGEIPVFWFCILNAEKYEYRAGLKGDAETDLKKAEWYRDYADKLIAGSATKCNMARVRVVPVEFYLRLKKKLEELQND